VVGSLNLLHACATRLLKRFVWLGTALEYKSQAAPLDETAPLEPLDPYGASKLTAWRSANSFFEREQLPLVTLRLFPVYGPREDAEKLVPFLCKAACKGEALRLERADSVTDYLHVSDAAAAVGHAIEGPLKDGEAYNVASERGVTQRELAEKIFACVGKKPAYVPVEAVASGLPLIGKAVKLRATGWSPRVDLDAGLKQTFEWYQARA
jgi:nucleoside-diphosphate-sugar epimerase